MNSESIFNKRIRLPAIMLSTCLLAIGIIVWTYSFIQSPAFIFLSHDKGAQWIRYDRAYVPDLLPIGTNEVAFRTSITIHESPQTARVSFRALRLARIHLDDRLIFEDTAPLDDWKRTRHLDIAPELTPGTHVLTFIAVNENGPSALLAYSDDLNLRSGTTWEASLDGVEWTSAASVDTVRPSETGHAFPRSDRALLSILPFLLPVFVLVTCWRYVVASGRSVPSWLVAATPSASKVRWGIIGAWVILAGNNILKIPAGHGFDVVGHMDYIHFLIEHHRLPLGTDGWKMNEAPLFYLVSAVPYSLIFDKLSLEGNVLAMRVIPLLCGLAQIEIAYRTLRVVFPDRDDLQAAGTVMASLIPINLYLSQYVSNQPLVAVLAALSLYLAYRYLRDPEPKPSSRYLLLGFVLGLALLTKLTAILLVVPLGILLLYIAYRDSGEERSFQSVSRPALLTMGVAGLVSAWYYLRNFLLIGTPFDVGYSESVEEIWRQDPGFHTLAHFTRFGESLAYPVYAVFASYWDSLYATFWTDAFISSGRYPDLLPPWNFAFMNAGALLALIPTALILGGIVASIAGPARGLREGSLFAVLLLATHVAGSMYLYLTVPFVSAGKSAYLLSLLPCFGILAAGGLRLLDRSKLAQAACTGAIACWAVSAYAAFFVL